MTKKTKIFIDGREGTTGLKILERFAGRSDLELIDIPDALRKDPTARAERLNAADIAFLCLPDDAAREAAAMVTNPNTRIIDASSAHRTLAGWAYGFPELSPHIARPSRPANVWRCPAATPAVFLRWHIRCGQRGFCPPITRWSATR